jgi:hypothetical protein
LSRDFAQTTEQLFTDTTYGLSDAEALWLALDSWLSFQPRHLKPRQIPGRLYYPAEYSQGFEMYWDHLPELAQHPDFASESPFCQEQMTRFSSALSTMDLSGFQPQVAAEAKDSDVETFQDAAISRLHPIRDGLDLWDHRSSPHTVLGAPAPDQSQAMP